MFLSTPQFAFASVLEAHWQAIYQDYLGVRHELIDWFEKELYGEGWKVFGIFDFPHGQAIAANVAKCRFTASLVAQHVPTHGAVGFSVLQPKTRIAPHSGYQGDFLRCHLGLQIPPGDCALQVAGDRRSWETGKTLVFDDRVEHEAWNLTDEERAVLLLDFVPQNSSAIGG